MKTEIQVKLSTGVEMPAIKFEGTQIDLQVHQFLNLFKGKKELDLDKINKVGLAKGYIVLRPFERALVSTGLSFVLPTGKVLKVASNPQYILNPGITTLSHFMGNNGELLLILNNPCQFLSKIYLKDVVAYASIVNCEEIELKD